VKISGHEDAVESFFKSAIAWETFIDPHYCLKSHTRLEVKWMQAVVTVMIRLLCKSIRNMLRLSRFKTTPGFNMDVTIRIRQVELVDSENDIGLSLHNVHAIVITVAVVGIIIHMRTVIFINIH
jgi:hypothetical protein